MREDSKKGRQTDFGLPSCDLLFKLPVTGFLRATLSLPPGASFLNDQKGCKESPKGEDFVFSPLWKPLIETTQGAPAPWIPSKVSCFRFFSVVGADDPGGPRKSSQAQLTHSGESAFSSQINDASIRQNGGIAYSSSDSSSPDMAFRHLRGFGKSIANPKSTLISHKNSANTKSGITHVVAI